MIKGILRSIGTTLTFLLLIISLTACRGGGGDSGSGGGSEDTTGALKISGSISNPPAVLGGEQTIVTISTYVSGSYVELQKSDGVNFFKLGEMRDDGQNGDQTAGDKVYTIQTTISESVADHVTLRILASSNGEEKTSTIAIPVVQIPSNVSDTEINQMANDLYQTGIGTQTLLTSINTDLDNVPLGTIEQIGNDLLKMFSDFETITKQDFFGLFNLAKDAKSLSQQLDVFSENPFDPRVNGIRQGVVSSGCLSEVDIEIGSPLERKLCARYYLFNSELNPDGEGVQLLKNAQKVTIKSLFSEATSLIGDGISELFSLSFLGSILVDEALDTGTGIIVDWYIDDNAEQNILIGQVQDSEEFTVPSGTHNILYSFGDDVRSAVVHNVSVVSQQTATVNFSPGIIVLASQLSSPNFLTVDQNNVYWTEAAGSVKKVGLYSGTVTTLTIRGPNYSSTATGITVDDVSVYWAVNPGGGNGNIYKIPIVGGTVTTLASANQPHDIVVDSTDVYWAENNGGTYGSNAVRKIPIDGGAVTALTTSGTGHGVMAMDNSYAYFRYVYNNIYKIGKVNKNGGNVIDLASNLVSSPEGIAVDNSYVYWVETNAGTINKVPINGGAVTTLATGLDDPQRIVVDTNRVYWTELANRIAGAGVIKKVPISGGQVTTLASGLNSPHDIAIDSTNIYWTEQGTDGTDGTVKKITKLTLSGGGSTVSNLPDTGQTKCYNDSTEITCPSSDEPFYGQDAQYTTNLMSFTDNGDGTVTDNVTGLMWQQEDDNQTYNWYEATGTYDATYNPDTTDVCGSLSLGGYSSWRLPTKRELMSIVNYGTYNPAIDSTVFPSTNAAYYWVSTIGVDNTLDAWNVHFYDGYAGDYSKTRNNYVRCVR